ncbi:subunit B of ATP synthase [Paenibacillus sp. 32O-W]|uniref:phasin family protein n=1 Tax=Paenibacillus sp. 32O-W TaxID=1695218 RepID=UPI00071F4E06|nr:phasin family protein [Paenibacillus sp. 32O-W]ALS28741.1 subunit B of ATP synthase [Paenibacillus sp. 32O-W]
MKDTIEKIISLGLGIVSAGKEQIEKTVDELVKKGEVNRTESKALVEELIKKGEEARQQIEAMARERVNAILGEMRLATQEDIARLERRLDALERKDHTEN